jgi:uroporphyrinogen decarboxylase
MFKPVHRLLNQRIHSALPGAKVLLHSCGSVRELIPDFIEAGFDAINPVQISAAGMDPAALKREFGSSIVLWGGGVDTQNTLSQGSAQAVREEARRLIETLAPGGGYIFAAAHNIQADVPPENIIALFETAAAYRKGGSS